jgi:hypothetical protein
MKIFTKLHTQLNFLLSIIIHRPKKIVCLIFAETDTTHIIQPFKVNAWNQKERNSKENVFRNFFLIFFLVVKPPTTTTR